MSGTNQPRRREDKLARWWFGGTASACAACFTHPFDLLKVHLQTQQDTKKKVTMVTAAKDVVSKQGLFALWNGISASILRQMTYSLARFGIYETGKQFFKPESFQGRIAIAAVAGAAGGLIGTPADLVNVRMQNDMKLPADSPKRRNYRNGFDGLLRVMKEEGVSNMFNGATMATVRATVMSIGQLSVYDQVKIGLLYTGLFNDNSTCHFSASVITGTIATAMTQPLDVLKTRMMNAKPGEYSGIWDAVKHTAKLGPVGFFKGFVPAFLRLAPHTVLMFMFLEQFRLNFGFYPPEKK